MITRVGKDFQDYMIKVINDVEKLNNDTSMAEGLATIFYGDSMGVFMEIIRMAGIQFMLAFLLFFFSVDFYRNHIHTLNALNIKRDGYFNCALGSNIENEIYYASNIINFIANE